LRLGVNILEVSSGAYECMKKGLASQPEIEILRLSRKNPGGVTVYTVTLKTICFRHLGVTQWFPLERHGAGVTPCVTTCLTASAPRRCGFPPVGSTARICVPGLSVADVASARGSNDRMHVPSCRPRWSCGFVAAAKRDAPAALRFPCLPLSLKRDWRKEHPRGMRLFGNEL